MNSDERFRYLVECLKDDQYAYFLELKEQILEQFNLLNSRLFNDDFKPRNLIETNSSKPIMGSNHKRMEEIEKQLQENKERQEKIIEFLDKFISLLSYSEQVQQQIDSLWVAIEQIKNQPERVELLKGTLEIPRGELVDVLEFYTIKKTGECGMSQSTLAYLAGISQQAMSKLQKTLTTKSPSEYLKPYTGQGLTLITNKEKTLTIDGQDVGNLTIYKADYCAAVITHYAMKGNNKTALHNLGNFCLIGINKWIHQITGYKND